MKRLIVLLAALCVASIVPAHAAVSPATPTGVVTGFTNPETAVWDARTNAWYITNNGGFGINPGSIAKLDAGSTTPTIFATGLTSPQGVVIFNRTLYVADASNLVEISMDDPTQRTVINVHDAGDLDVDPATGDVYVGSISDNEVRRVLPDGTVEDWAKISSPDGVYFSDGGVYVCTLGIADQNSGLFKIDVATKQMTQIANLPFGTFDGLEKDGDTWLMTDFGKGQLWRVDNAGNFTLLAQLTPGSAQLGIDPATRQIAVPDLLTSVVTFLQL